MMPAPFLAASFSLALQVAPPATATATAAAETTTAAATAGMVATRAPLKNGASLTAVPLSSSTPWSVTQLHVLLAPELRPDARAAATSWAHHLAHSGQRLLPVGATASVLVHADAAVVSFGVEAARLDDALKAVDAALRARSAPPVDLPRVGTLAVVDDAVGAAAAARLFAGHPRSLPVDAPTSAAAQKLLADAIDASAVHIVVAGSDTDAGLVARAQRLIGAPLPKRTTPELWRASTPSPPALTTLESGALSARTTLIAPAGVSRAAVWVVAELLGGRSVRAGLQHGVSVDVDDIDAVRARLVNVSDADVAAARSRVVRDRASALTNPAKLAYAIGQAGLFDPTLDPIAAVLGAVEAVSVDDVRAAGGALAQAVVERGTRPRASARSTGPTLTSGAK